MHACRFPRCFPIYSGRAFLEGGHDGLELVRPGSGLTQGLPVSADDRVKTSSRSTCNPLERRGMGVGCSTRFRPAGRELAKEFCLYKLMSSTHPDGLKPVARSKMIESITRKTSHKRIITSLVSLVMSRIPTKLLSRASRE